MATLQGLIDSRKELRKTIPTAEPCQLKKAFLLPDTNSIAIHSIFNTKTDHENPHHLVLIVFKELNVDYERDADHPIGFEVFPGDWRYSERPSKSRTRVAVNCTCRDYYYTWWKWNSREAAYAGVNLPKYTRKTPAPPKGYPYKNPNQVEGVCKHIFFTAQKIAESNGNSGPWMDD